MNGAEGVLAINVAVAGMFAAGYALLAITNPGQRRALGFSLCYVLGMLSPAAEFLVATSGQPAVFEWVSYGAFLAATLSISFAFGAYHGEKARFDVLLTLIWMGLSLRAFTWTLPRDSLAYGFSYQIPFCVAALLAVAAVYRAGPRRPLNLALMAVFATLALNFLTKPFLLVALGSGASLGAYITTRYALVSQASTGILMLAAGLILLLIVAQKTIGDLRQSAETDPLSQLLNRRGFDRLAHLALRRAESSRLPLAAVVFDLDHFKRVNDTLGHSVGDAVIERFAQRLRQVAPPDAVIGRAGGEEFVVLLPATDLAGARLLAEGVRSACAQPGENGLPRVTVSGGIAELSAGEPLQSLMRRADEAAYDAKRAGRNLIGPLPPPEQALAAG
ncbi:GGDEF domain-containing protein [Phenylobacterium sp.]|jgi:diguanylate cyclase (GGDEF)-like protein|uniref:GGDEF domain-containing protein n=1 Tax=Phenylobacterium sp. TaxID=1871053 RepID=UPI002F936FEF